MVLTAIFFTSFILIKTFRYFTYNDVIFVRSPLNGKVEIFEKNIISYILVRRLVLDLVLLR